MSEYKRLTTNEPEDNVETMLNYAHSKDKEVFIYDEQGNEVKLTEYIAKHAQEECEVTAEEHNGGLLLLVYGLSVGDIKYDCHTSGGAASPSIRAGGQTRRGNAGRVAVQSGRYGVYRGA